MRTLLCFILLIGLSLSRNCPPNYLLLEGRCIIVITEADVIIDNDLSTYREQCAKDGAYLPIIKSDEENEAFNKIVTSIDDIRYSFLLLDLDCNSQTRRLEWEDGTDPAIYSPNNGFDFNFDCVKSKETAYSYPYVDNWYTTKTNEPFYCAVMCVYDGPSLSTTASPIDEPCGDYSVIDVEVASKPCFKVFSDLLSWEQAQERCSADFGSLLTINSADENKYFWRTAISNNLLDGMHIGAHLPNGSSQWSWVDGEVPLDGDTYANFIGSFPIPGGGDCSSMMTESTSVLWINENCNGNMQPFMCRRADFSSLPKTCPTVAPKAGEDFFPPGFPESDIPCEYVLFVAVGRLVELEVITVIADENKDFLEVLEGTSGPHLLANLTGTILSTTKFATVESNVMRVNWKPNGSGSGRGFRIRYNEVGE